MLSSAVDELKTSESIAYSRNLEIAAIVKGLDESDTSVESLSVCYDKMDKKKKRALSLMQELFDLQTQFKADMKKEVYDSQIARR